MYPPRGHVSIQDAREVYELCKSVSNLKSRDAIYAMHGMDGYAVDKYLHTVEKLEHLYTYTRKHVLPEYEKPAHKELLSFQLGPFTFQVSSLDLI